MEHFSVGFFLALVEEFNFRMRAVGKRDLRTAGAKVYARRVFKALGFGIELIQ
jgi:hypothetical protein